VIIKGIKKVNMNNTVKFVIVTAVLLVASVLLGIFFTPRQTGGDLTMNDYLLLDIWEKEKNALKMMDNIPELPNLEEAKKAVKEVSATFGEIEAYIRDLKISDPEILKKNRIQLDICRIFQDMAVKFEKVDSYNTDALKDLAVINQKLLEFFEMAPAKN
jgi:hypothetical protein